MRFFLITCKCVLLLCLTPFDVSSRSIAKGTSKKEKQKGAITLSSDDSGDETYSKAEALFKKEAYDDAAEGYWMALLKASTGRGYTVRIRKCSIHCCIGLSAVVLIQYR